MAPQQMQEEKPSNAKVVSLAFSLQRWWTKSDLSVEQNGYKARPLY